MSVLTIKVFNQTELNKLMKQAKKETFLYKQEVGFCNGYIIIADSSQVRAFVKNEFMFVQDMFYRYCEQANVGKTMLEDLKSSFETACTLKASITDFTKQSRLDAINKRSLRVFKSDKGNFVIDTKFLNVIADPFNDNVVYFIDPLMQKLLVKTKDGEFIAGILGFRTDDEQQAALNSIDDMEV